MLFGDAKRLSSVVMVTLGTCLLLWHLPLINTLLKPSYQQILDYFSRDRHGIAVTPGNKQSETGSHDQQNIFSYQNLGISAPLTKTDNTNPLSYSDWNSIRSSLKHGVNISYSGDDYNQTSLIYVIGHSSDYDAFNPYATIFAGLGQSKTGDTFTLEIEGQTMIFRVTDRKTLNPTDEKAFNALIPTDPHVQRAVLVTCWPVLTTWNRLVIVGERDK